MAEKSEERERLKARQAELADDANDNIDGSIRPKEALVPRDQMTEAICTQGILAAAFWSRIRDAA